MAGRRNLRAIGHNTTSMPNRELPLSEERKTKLFRRQLPDLLPIKDRPRDAYDGGSPPKMEEPI